MLAQAYQLLGDADAAERERDAGKTNRVIADELFMSQRTVTRHIANIFTKLSLSSRTAAAAYAIERGPDGSTRQGIYGVMSDFAGGSFASLRITAGMASTADNADATRSQLSPARSCAGLVTGGYTQHA